MTKEDIKKFMPLMQAMLEGKTIQCYHKLNKEWVDIDDIFIGNDISLYRIKPEPKYRPFRTRRECWDEMLKHQPFGWLKSKENEFCINIGEVSWKEGYGDVVITFYTSKPFSLYSNAAYREYTFADGAPFGVIEEQYDSSRIHKTCRSDSRTKGDSDGISDNDHREYHHANGSEKKGDRKCPLNPKTNLATQRTGRRLERES